MNEPATECTATRAVVVWKPRMVMQWKTTGSVKRIASRPLQRCTVFAVASDSRTTARRCPHIRAPVEICTNASTTANVASQTLARIGAENTVVTTSPYDDATSTRGRATRVFNSVPPPAATVAPLAALPRLRYPEHRHVRAARHEGDHRPAGASLRPW